MKPYLNFLCALMSATLCAASLAAAPSPQPGGCRIQLGGGAAVDYGKIKRHLLRAAEAAALPPQQRSLAIICDQPAAIALRQSAGDGSASAAAGSRLGVTPDASQGIGLVSGKPLGAAVLRWRPTTATVDGVPARLIVSSDGGATWREMEGDAATAPTDMVAWARGDQRRPASGRTLTVGVRIETAIAPTSTLYLGREALLDGSITLSAIFQ